MSLRSAALFRFPALATGAVFTSSVAILIFAAVQPAAAQSRVIQKWLATMKDPAQVQSVPPGDPLSLVNDATANSNGGITIAGDICAAVDSSGSCTSQEFTIETYNAKGQRLWGSYISSAAKNAEATHVINDTSGDIYAAGWEQNANGTQSMMLVKYSPSGTREWIRYYGFYQNASVKGFHPDAIGIDGHDNIYVVGEYSENPPVVDVTFKFSPSGQLLWMSSSSSFNSSMFLFPHAIAASMLVDPRGNVYIAFNDFQNGGDLLKYGPKGTVQWRIMGAPDPDSKESLAFGPSGNIYMEGSAPYNPSATGNVAFAAKFDPAGDLLWKKEAAAYCKDNADLGYGSTINVDRYGNAFLSSHNCSSQLMVTKFDPSGNLLWQRNYTGVSDATPLASYLNGAGDLYVLAITPSANAQPNSKNTDYLTVKYDSSGDLQWATRFSGLDDASSSEPITMAASGGDLFVAGSTGDSTNAPSSWATLDYVQDAADSTPRSLSFSSQPVDTTSAPQRVTLKNTSVEELQLRNIAMQGQFSETNNCSSEIVAGGSCTLEVRFTPTSTGTQTGSLSIYDQWAGTPDVVSLSGTGAQPVSAGSDPVTGARVRRTSRQSSARSN